jgi:beta-xylosidase
VLFIGGQYVLYYAAVAAATGQQCLSEAVAPQPQGPFIDTSPAPMVCQANFGGDIDPDAFVDTDGTPYLLWKSIGQPNLIWSQQLNPAGTAVTGTGPTPILGAGQSWEEGIVEAPDLVLSAGRYFLFYSGNNWNSANYAIGVATCTGPLGPCTKPLTEPILTGGPGVAGPGGESVFADSTGALWIAFHAWAPGAVGYPNSRALYVRPLDFSGATPVVEPAG